MRNRNLKSGVKWQGAFRQEGIKQTDIKQELEVQNILCPLQDMVCNIIFMVIYFKPFLIGNISDKFLPTRTLL
jgi:hypothetical protein